MGVYAVAAVRAAQPRPSAHSRRRLLRGRRGAGQHFSGSHGWAPRRGLQRIPNKDACRAGRGTHATTMRNACVRRVAIAVGNKLPCRAGVVVAYYSVAATGVADAVGGKGLVGAASPNFHARLHRAMQVARRALRSAFGNWPRRGAGSARPWLPGSSAACACARGTPRMLWSDQSLVLRACQRHAVSVAALVIGKPPSASPIGKVVGTPQQDGCSVRNATSSARCPMWARTQCPTPRSGIRLRCWQYTRGGARSLRAWRRRAWAQSLEQLANGAALVGLRDPRAPPALQWLATPRQRVVELGSRGVVPVARAR